MNRYIQRRPKGPKKPRKRKGADKPYLAWIHTLPCSVQQCKFETGHPLGYRMEAHHAGEHGLSQRAPDRTAIPLCQYHHRLGTTSVHELGKIFWDFHRIDRDALIAKLNAEYDSTCATAPIDV